MSTEMKGLSPYLPIQIQQINYKVDTCLFPKRKVFLLARYWNFSLRMRQGYVRDAAILESVFDSPPQSYLVQVLVCDNWITRKLLRVCKYTYLIKMATKQI